MVVFIYYRVKFIGFIVFIKAFMALWFSCKIMYYSSYTFINLCFLKLEEYFNKSCFYLSSVCFSFESLRLLE